MAKPNLTKLQSGFGMEGKFNAALKQIEDYFDRCLLRNHNVGEANAMQVHLDFNNKRAYNLSSVETASLKVGGIDYDQKMSSLQSQADAIQGTLDTAVSDAQGYASSASSSASSASASATAASGSASSASSSASEALGYRNTAYYHSSNAAASASTATTKASEASTHSAAALSYSNQALAYRNDAEGFKDSASSSASASSASASSASSFASTASWEAGNAANSASLAEGFKNNAQTYAAQTQSDKNYVESIVSTLVTISSEPDNKLTTKDGELYVAPLKWGGESVTLDIYRTEPGGSPSPNSLFFAPSGVYITDGDANVSIVNKNNIVFAADNAERDSVLPTLTVNSLLYVVSEGELYVYDVVTSTAYKIEGGGGGGTPATVYWGDIINKPSSTAGSIDTAVTNSHTHSNATYIDKIGETGGKPTYNGEGVLTAASLVNTTGNSTSQGITQYAATQALNGKLDSTDASVTNAREWTAAEVTQAEAQAGTDTTAKKWTAQRVRQAITYWWENVASNSWFRSFMSSSTSQANARTALGLTAAATATVDTSSLTNNTAYVPSSSLVTSLLSNKANTSTSITAGSGLTGGGTLASNRSLSVSFGFLPGQVMPGDNIVQSSGTSTTALMSQNAVTNEIATAAEHSNLIINGGFDFWQRSTSQTAGGYGSADRWAIEKGGTDAILISRQYTPTTAAAVPCTKFLDIKVEGANAAAAYIRLVTRLEDIRRFLDKVFVFSFYARSTTSAGWKIGTEFVSYYGSGGSGPLFGGNNTLALTTSWNRFAVPFVVSTMSGKTIGDGSYLSVNLWLSGGSNFTARFGGGVQNGLYAQITGCKLEEGNYATAYRNPDLSEELVRCKRYYEQGNYGASNYTTANGYFGLNYPFTVEKRIVPSITTTAVANENIKSDGMDAIFTDGFYAFGQAVSEGAAKLRKFYKADAEL